MSSGQDNQLETEFEALCGSVQIEIEKHLQIASNELESDRISEISGVWGDYIEEMFGSHGGWVHSAVC
jgi:hypothetical protein